MISKVAGIGVAASLALAVTANTAQALSFNFTFDADGTTVTGRVDGLVDNSTSPGVVRISNPITDTFATLTASPFSNSFEVTGGVVTSTSFVNDSLNGGPQLRLSTLFGNTIGSYASTASPATYTPVPFGVSTDMSIAILAGLYGASRLRKKFAASNNK